MSKRARYSRDVVAIGTMVLSAAFVAACEGGPGNLDGNGLQLYQPPPDSGSYRDAVDDGPPVTDGLGNPIGNDGPGESVGKGGSSSSGKGGSSSGKGGSDSGKGGTNGGGNGTCAEVVAALLACPELEVPQSAIPTITAQCEPYSGSCKACIAALDCDDLAVVVSEQGPEGSKCSNDCKGGGDGGTGGTGGSSSGKGGTGGTGGTGGSSSGKGGTGGTGGTGGSSSSGNCADDLVAKSNECDDPVDAAQAEQICDLAPACAACVTATPCSSIQSVCESACNVQ